MTNTTEVVQEAAVVSGEDVVARIDEILPLLASNATIGDRERRSSQESVDALKDAGVFRIAVPARWGGYQTSIRNQLEVSSKVGEVDGGLAWVTTLTNIGAWLVGLQGEQLQEEIFGQNPDARTVGVLAPSVTAKPVDGGWRVTGKGFYASGSLHADWAGNGAILLDDQGNPAGQAMVFAPIADLSIDDTWYVAGMRGSGSNCIVWDDVFVPSHRVFDIPRAVATYDYPTEHRDEWLYRAAFSSTAAVVLAGPQLGIGRAALAYVIAQAQKKGIAYTTFGLQKESVAFQVRVAKAATLIKTAHLHAYDAADTIDEWARQGHVASIEERAQIRAQTSWAVESITSALDELLTAHGSGGFAESSLLQRLWRDSNVAARHAFVLPDISYESYGKALLGVDAQITPIL